MERFKMKYLKGKKPPKVPKAKSVDIYWESVRKVIWERDQGKCQICGEDGYDVHHKTYSIQGFELDYLDQLALVCRNCHKSIHFKNPHCENSIQIIFDSGIYKEQLNSVNSKNLAGNGAISCLIKVKTLWDELYILENAADAIQNRIKNLKIKEMKASKKE